MKKHYQCIPINNSVKLLNIKEVILFIVYTVLYLFSWTLVKNIPSNHIREMNNISGVEFKSVPIYWSKTSPHNTKGTQSSQRLAWMPA